MFYLQRKYGMTYTRATSTVIMDKLLEFLANFFLLVFGLMAVLAGWHHFHKRKQTARESDRRSDAGGAVGLAAPSTSR